MSKEKTLIIGAGEIGKSLKNVLEGAYEVAMIDKGESIPETFRVINVCYPYSEAFISITEEYIAIYKPELVIIHSTVPPGTTRKLGRIAVNSPTNGRHPDLTEHIKTFEKVIAGVDVAQTAIASKFLEAAGMQTIVFSSPEASELAKICCTSVQYALSIIAMKEIYALCEKYKVPFFEVYTRWNQMYNDGYTKIGEDRFHRPNLVYMPGGIGGHCVIGNCDLLDHWVTNMVKVVNNKYREEK